MHREPFLQNILSIQSETHFGAGNFVTVRLCDIHGECETLNRDTCSGDIPDVFNINWAFRIHTVEEFSVNTSCGPVHPPVPQAS